MQRNLAKGLDPSTLRDMRTDFNQAVSATGDYAVQSIKAKSATQAFTEALVKQDIGLRRAINSRHLFNDALKEQYRLQRMMTVQYSRNASGTVSADIIAPTGVTRGVERMTSSWRENIKVIRESRTAMKAAASGSLEAAEAAATHAQAANILKMRLAMVNQVANSVGDNMIKWGKNTQWAGRQLMVGFTVPFAAFAAVAGKMAYDVDKELTRIAKVYDTTARVVSGSQAEMVARDQELGMVRENSLNLAIQAAKRYGSAIKDTLDVTAQLAATGLSGKDLYQSTSEVMRISTLGEMDYNKSVEMSIALQTAFKLSTEDTAKAMNYMNSVENATSLSLQDFADATPRAASALASLGVTVEEMGVLLVAMKERGVNAAQGANALKSATTRMLRPTEKTVAAFDKFGISIMDIREQSGGNLFKALSMMGAEFKRVGLSALDANTLIAEAFGTYQFNRLNAALQGVTDMSGQTGKAMELMSRDATYHANMARAEIAKIQDSPSGKFKAMVETMKGEVAKLGEPFLQFAGIVLKSVNGILGFFNSLPKGVKVAVIGLMALMAVAGPLIMITGLMSNMMGQAIKMGTSVGMMTSKFRALTVEQRAQEMLANQTSIMWKNETATAQALTFQLKQLAGAFQDVATNQAAANGSSFIPGAAAGAVPGALKKNKAGKLVRQNGNFASAAEIAAHEAAEKSAAAVAESTAKTGRNWSLIASRMTALGTGVGMMGMMATESGSVANHLSTAVMMAALVGPSLIKGLAGGALVGKLKGIGGAFKAARGGGAGIASSLGTAIKNAAGLVKVFARFAGPVGLVITGAAGIYSIVKGLREARAEAAKLSGSSEDWSNILGYTYQPSAGLSEAKPDETESQEALAKGLEKANKPLVDMLKNYREIGNEQRLLNAAIEEGIRVRTTGGDAVAAEQAVRTSLFAAGVKDKAELENLVVKVKAQINFESPVSVIRNQVELMGDTFERISKNKFEQSRQEGLVRLFGGGRGDNKLNIGAQEAAKGMAQNFWNVYANEDKQARLKYFNQFEQQITQVSDKVFNSINSKSKAALADAGINNFNQLSAAMTAQSNGTLNDPKKLAAMATIPSEVRDSIIMTKNAEEALVRSLIESSGLTSDAAKNATTLAQARRVLPQATMSIADAQKAYNAALERGMLHSNRLSDAEQLNLLNKYRMAAGADLATSTTQGFTMAVKESSAALEENSDSFGANMFSVEEWESAYTDATKSAMSGSMDLAYGAADDVWSRVTDAEIDAIENGGERRSKALDDSNEAADESFKNRGKSLDDKWEGIMDRQAQAAEDNQDRIKDVYDGRIDKINDAIKAEEKAENVRQRIFEAEEQRLERLASLENKRIDFNFALNTGDVDEAAKVMNDITADQSKYANEDLSASNEDAAARRKEVLAGRVDALEKERDARLDTAKDLADAEKKALEEKKEREKEALEAERDRYRKSSEAQKAKISEETRRDVEAKRLERERQKRNLELELLAIRASTPRNAAEYNAQIAQVEAAYGKYGVRLKEYGNEWTNYIGAGLKANIAASAASLQDSINWREIANEIAGKFSEGAFGLSIDQFAKWISTGELPAQGLAPMAKASATREAGTNATNERKGSVAGSNAKSTRHTGGRVDKSMGSRAGVTASASRYPSEVDTRLRVGEYVVQKKAVNKYGMDFMASLNDGELPTYHKGGSVTGLAGFAGAGIAGMMGTAIRGSMMLAAARKMGMQAPENPFKTPTTEPSAGIGPINFSGGGLTAPDRFAPWMTPLQRQVDSTVMARVGAALASIPGGQTITSGLRPGAIVAGTNRPSLHGAGKAVDIGALARARGGSAKTEAEGDAIAALFRSGQVPGVREVLWKTMSGGDHYNHVHVGFRHKGGPIESSMTKGLKSGGYTLNDGYAKLHANEAVLTAPLTQDLKSGIQNLDRNTNNRYNVVIDLRGAVVRDDLDIKKAVQEVIEEKELRAGRSRRIK